MSPSSRLKHADGETLGEGGATAPQDLNLTKQVDKASTPLMDHVVEGTLYDSAELVVRTTDDEDD